MPDPHSDPLHIAQEVMDRTAAALIKEDFDTFASYFSLPQKMETFEGTRWLETPADLKEAFLAVTHYLKSAGATQIIRHCIEAEFKDADTIFATSESRILRRDQLIQQPFPMFSMLHHENGNWKVTGTVYAIADAPEYARALIGMPAPARRETQTS